MKKAKKAKKAKKMASRKAQPKRLPLPFKTPEPKIKTLVLAPNEAVELISPPGHTLGLVADPPKRALIAAPVPAKKKRGWFTRMMFG